MKKILFAVENYYPETSGVPVVVRYLAEGLALNPQYEISVATRNTKKILENERYNNVQIHRFNIRNNCLKKACGNINEYRKFIIEGEFDVIIFECTQCVTTDSILNIIDKINAKVILHSHGFSGMSLSPFKVHHTIKNTMGNTLNFFIWRNYYKEILPKYLNLFSCFICLSNIDNDYNYLTAYRPPIYIIPNAAEDMFFEESYVNEISKYTGEEIYRYMINVSYYSDVKNQIGILEQWYMSKASDDFSMVFIGTEKNDYYKKLQMYYDKLKLNNKKKAFFLTNVDRNHIPGILGGAELYLLGSRREAFPISLIEAMAVGTPFVATNVGNVYKLPGGIVVNNINQLHTGINKVFCDAKLYNMLKAKGKEYVYEKCRVSKVVDQLIKVIESI